MSEQDKRRGPQGVQGVQGVEGIEGQGTQGIQGIQGERGIAGRGTIPPKILLAFVIVIAVAFAILIVFALQVRQTRQVSRENGRVIESLCHTTATLDAAVIVPFLIETKLAIKAAPVGQSRTRLVRLKGNLEIAHNELSASQLCVEAR